MLEGCAIAISSTQFLLIGGNLYNNGKSSSVHEFSSVTGSWTTWPSLSRTRNGHACGKLGGKVVVAGGAPSFSGGHQDWAPSRTTEVIDLVTREVRPGGDMASPRDGFVMAEVGVEGSSILLTYGSNGFNLNGGEDSLLQEEWIPSPAVLSKRHPPKSVTVDASLVCPEGAGSGDLQGSLLGFCEDWHLNSTNTAVLEYCKPNNVDDGERTNTASCFSMPCYALNSCPRIIQTDVALGGFPCCCAHPCVRNKFEEKCASLFVGIFPESQDGHQ